MNAPETQTPELSQTSATNVLLQQILNSLERSNPSARDDSRYAHSRFWSVYKTEADEYDNEFLKKYNGDLDIVLIFSGLFSAVSTTFIAGMQPDLTSDPDDTTHALLQLVAQSLNSSAFPSQTSDLPEWDGPPGSVIWTQAILYASLSASLLAAFGAVLGKQWLSYYDRVGVRGTIDVRCKERQEKLDGIEHWHFRAVIDVLPVLLQFSLLLFGVGLAADIYMRQRIVGSIIIAATALGVGFYVAIVCFSIISDQCPFRTLVGDFLRQLISSARNVWAGLHARFANDETSHSWKMRLHEQPPFIRICIRPFTALSRALLLTWKQIQLNAPKIISFLEQRQALLPDGPPTFVFTSQATSHADARAVAWILETSTDVRVIEAAALIVPEIEWPPSMDMYNAWTQIFVAFEDCFERGNRDKPVLKPFARDRAITTGKALLHMFFEHNNTQPGRGRWAAMYDLRRTTLRDGQVVWTWPDALPHTFWLMEYFMTDVELDCICKCIIRALHPNFPGHENPGPLLATEVFDPALHDIPSSLLPWATHSLPYLIPRDTFQKHLSDVLSTSPLLGYDMLADALAGVGVAIGLSVNKNSLYVRDKSHQFLSILEAVLTHIQVLLPIEGDAPEWNRQSLHALHLLPSLFNLVEDQNAGRTFHETSLPLWCLRFAQSLAQKTPVSVDPRLNVYADVGLPLIGPHCIMQYENIIQMMLRLSVQSAGQPGLAASSARRPWTIRYHHVDHIHNMHPHFNPMRYLPYDDLDWAFAHALQYKDSVHVTDDDLQACADALWVFSTVLYIDVESYQRILDVALWAMNASHPLALRDAGLKLIDRLCFSQPPLPHYEPVAAQLPSLLSLLESIPVAQHMHSSSQRPINHRSTDRDMAYTHVICTFAATGKWDRSLFEQGHIDKCVDIARLDLVDVEHRTTDWGIGLAMHHWKTICQLLILYGWSPEDEQLRERLYFRASRNIYGDYEDFLDSDGRPLRELVRDSSGIYRLQQRAAPLLAWFESRSLPLIGEEMIQKLQVLRTAIHGHDNVQVSVAAEDISYTTFLKAVDG
ncbi:hypothetical protein HGRIS_009418 [Hohenbuehelia grisea]|uniref:DUF6535 domain-containing protein n=1 Tax=Hohenbuehelia grisea TaxID=104357 RepID=A0ABR3J1H5_9AGAR